MAFSISKPPATNVTTSECGTCGCPTCGGLQCLCRPRFFAGQLLTDEALNNLEHYIVEKNKLHNRYLHGWGVVCGLEVVCNPCNAVTVRGGYALSPCGEDVVVCKDVTVDVCSLINQCKDKRRDWECEPLGMGDSLDCYEAEEDWILTVRYDETTSRGITALRGGNAPACCSSCSCGGSSGSGGGCGCGGGSSAGGGGNGNGKGAYATAGAGSVAKTNYRPATATVAAQCEPTLTCEGYVFEVCKPLPEKSAVDTVRGALGLQTGTKGAMVDRLNACILNFLATLPKKPEGANVTKQALYQWCCDTKRALRDNLFDHPVYNCQLADKLNFTCPDPNTNLPLSDYEAQLDDLLKDVMAVVGGEYIRYCLCSIFLPPCPEVVCDPRVPLATVKVRKDRNGTCRVVRVCNLGKRRHVITFPTLGYWFSFVLTPLTIWFKKILELICCQPWRIRDQTRPQTTTPINNVAGSAVSDEQPSNAQPSNAQPSEATSKPTSAQTLPPSVTDKRGFKAFAGQVWVNRGRTVNEETLFLGAVGAKGANNQPYLAQTELANPFYTLTVNRMAGPLLAKLPEDSLDLLKLVGKSIAGRRFDKTIATDRTAATHDEVAAASEEVGNLKAQVAELQAAIAELRKMVKPKE